MTDRISATGLPRTIKIKSCSNNDVIFAEIIRLTEKIASENINLDWWADLEFRDTAEEPQDLSWDWADLVTLFGPYREMECVAVRVGDGSIQGAMIVGLVGISRLEAGLGSAHIERLATAPANRSDLVIAPQYSGVGTQLLAWASFQSYLMGWEGRVDLSAFDRAEDWYRMRGFAGLGTRDSEGLTEMELPKHEALRLLRSEEYIE